MRRTARFLRHFLRPSAATISAEEIEIGVRSGSVSATLIRPGRLHDPLPAWIVLHGITVPGRKHPMLSRFAASLAATGASVLVPDIPAWRELRTSVSAAVDTIEGGLEYFNSLPELAAGRVGVVGFSFGATQALVASTDPRIAGRLHRLVGFGGYGDLHRVCQFLMTGHHDWEGRQFHADPDPYGRWIVGLNNLTRIPEFQECERVEDGLLRLATEAGRQGLAATTDAYDPLKAAIRETLTLDERRVWDLFAPPAGRPLEDSAAVRDLAGNLADAAIAAEPRLAPQPYLRSLSTSVVLGHGSGDLLIPFTETLRLASCLPDGIESSVIITGVLAHSAGAGGLHPLLFLREGAHFVRLLRRALA